MKTAVIVSTFNRPHFLLRSLPHIAVAAARIQAPVLVVDDHSTECTTDIDDGLRDLQEICEENGATYFQIASNRGLAGALNIGLSYWLADPDIQAISYFQDDVEVDLYALEVLRDLCDMTDDLSLYTCHDGKEHGHKGEHCVRESGPGCGIHYWPKYSCRATHMHATRRAWSSVMPIRSKGLGLPKRLPGQTPLERGEGSGVDWWVVRDSPRKLNVICVPGLVRTFAFKAEDSCWNNPQKAGEDAPMSRAAITGWMKARGYDA